MTSPSALLVPIWVLLFAAQESPRAEPETDAPGVAQESGSPRDADRPPQAPREGDGEGPPFGGFGPFDRDRGPGGRGGPGGFGGPGGPGGGRMQVVAHFDADGNGRLDEIERARARTWVKERRANQGRRGGRGFGPPGGPGFPGSGNDDSTETVEAERLKPQDVESFAGKDLYDPSILRTIFLEFPSDDWEAEVADFYRTDVAVPANMIVDGKTYRSVGVRFRGNSSFFSVPAGRKRSMRIELDHVDPDQKIDGYKSLKLLNSHSDPSFLREALFNNIASSYHPAPKTNFVKVVINGESHGVFVNVEQLNKEFLDEWYGTRGGVRWKVSPGAGRGLDDLGDDLDEYKANYQLKTEGAPESAWEALRDLCRILSRTPPERLEAELAQRLDIDSALWFIAVDSVLLDGDGYLSRASDYAIYLDPRGRFHLHPHDSNESFGLSGGPGVQRRGRGGRGGPGAPPPEGARGERDDRGPGGPPPEGERRPFPPPGPGFGGGGPRDRLRTSPLAEAESDAHPLVRALLSVPEFRARYLAHVRTIAEESLDWKVIGPIAAQYREVIGDEIAKDPRKLYSLEAYEKSVDEDVGSGRRSTPGIRRVVEERREYLLSLPELTAPRASILSVDVSVSSGEKSPSPRDSLDVVATVATEVELGDVILWFARGRNRPFEAISMTRDGESEGTAATFRATIPPSPAGTIVRIYVEARTTGESWTTSFYPARAEHETIELKVRAPRSESSPIRIARFMAENQTDRRDPQGQADDWIELQNVTDRDVDLSGMYLSDNPENPRKWRFPKGSLLVAGGVITVWADEDEEDVPGYHANFKLSAEGETILLVDRDDRGNAILDEVRFERLGKNEIGER